MGIVKISDDMHYLAKRMAKAMGRSINAQAEYWMRIGRLMEENPNITHPEIIKMLIDQAAVSENVYVSEDR